MSYGKWKALHPVVEVEMPKAEVKRPCKICGGEIPPDAHKHTLYCGAQCSYEADKLRHREHYRRKKERMMADGKI